MTLRLEAQRRELDELHQVQLAEHLQRGATLRWENDMLRRRLAEISPDPAEEAAAAVAPAPTLRQTAATPVPTAAVVTVAETAPTTAENSAAPTLTADASALRAQAAAAEAARDAALAVSFVICFTFRDLLIVSSSPTHNKNVGF